MRGALWAAAAGGPASGKGRERVTGDPRAWGAVRSAPASAPPASEGGTGALRTQAARAPAGSSTTASWTPGQPPPGAAAALQRTRERTHRARIATGGALDAAGLGYSRGCKVMGSPDWLAASSRFASGTGQVAGVWGGGSGQLPPSYLGARERGPGGGGDGSWAPPSSATPPSAPGGGALATGSALRTCPPHPRPSRLPQGGLWRPALLQPQFQLETGIQP